MLHTTQFLCAILNSWRGLGSAALKYVHCHNIIMLGSPLSPTNNGIVWLFWPVGLQAINMEKPWKSHTMPWPGEWAYRQHGKAMARGLTGQWAYRQHGKAMEKPYNAMARGVGLQATWKPPLCL